MSAEVKRAMTITAALNRLTFNDAEEIRNLFSELIGKTVDTSFVLIPPSTQPAEPTPVLGAMSSSIRTALSMTLAASTSATT